MNCVEAGSGETGVRTTSKAWRPKSLLTVIVVGTGPDGESSQTVAALTDGSETGRERVTTMGLIPVGTIDERPGETPRTNVNGIAYSITPRSVPLAV